VTTDPEYTYQEYLSLRRAINTDSRRDITRFNWNMANSAYKRKLMNNLTRIAVSDITDIPDSDKVAW